MVFGDLKDRFKKMSSQAAAPRAGPIKPSEAPFEETWSSIVQNMDQIFLYNKISKGDYLITYTHVHNICSSNPLLMQSDSLSLNDTVTELDLSNGKWLYDRLEAYLHSACSQILERLKIHSGVRLLQECVGEWEKFEEAMRQCNNIFCYLNTSWIRGVSPREGPELVVENLGYHVWNKIIFGELCQPVGETILKAIFENRQRTIHDVEMIKKAVKIYVIVNFGETGQADRQPELDLYVRHIEDPFVLQVAQYYTELKEEHFNSCFNSVEAYIRKVDSFLSFERQYIEKYLCKSSHLRIETVLREILVVSMAAEILAQIDDFVSQNKYAEIKLIFELFTNCPDQMNELKLFFEDLVFKYGTNAIEELYSENDDVNPTHFVDVVIKTHDRFQKVVQKSFSDFKLFYSYVERGCCRFVNNGKCLPPHHSPAVILSLHCDSVIRQSSRLISKTNTERDFCRMILLLRLIKEKDIFQSNHAKSLARRLIVSYCSKSSLALERDFISLLKKECGQDYTCKLSRMLAEAANFEVLNERFLAFLHQKHLVPSYNVNVVVFSPWPFEESYNIKLPAEMEQICQEFEEFYCKKNEGRKISWLHNHSYGEVVITCFKREYHVAATTHQIVVLMLFNDSLRLTFHQIAEVTLIEHEDLVYTCASLLKHGLLLAEDSYGTPKDSKLERTDWLCLNVNFSSTMLRLNIVIPERIRQTEDKSNVVVNVVHDREMLIKSLVVRMMKQRGEANHNELVNELIDYLSPRFVPDVSMVKEAIEAMIEKEYISRSADNQLIYHYVA